MGYREDAVAPERVHDGVRVSILTGEQRAARRVRPAARKPGPPRVLGHENGLSLCNNPHAARVSAPDTGSDASFFPGL
jgi:hypothetical protein